MEVKENNMNWINSWRQGNKKDNIYDISLRLGRFTILELYCKIVIYF